MCEYLLRSQLSIDFQRRECAKFELVTCNLELFDFDSIRNVDRSNITRHIDLVSVRVIDFEE